MLSVNTAIRIWDILVEAGAPKDEMAKMSFWLQQSKEFRPEWKFGDGLYFKRNSYPIISRGEESWQIISKISLTAEKTEIIAKANIRLFSLKQDCPNEL